MSATWTTYEQFKSKGMAARASGNWPAARVYLLHAADALSELAEATASDELREARLATAERLLNLAKAKPQPRLAKLPSPTDKNLRTRPGGLGSANLGGGEGGEATDADNQTSTEVNADAWLVREKPSVRFSDVAGLEDVKQEILLRMVYPLNHPELARKFRIRAGGGVLLYGPPGTGKTLLARAIAGEIDAAFFCVSAGDLLSKWVGEAEQNVQKLFAAARQEKRAVIFLDEIEALVPARREDGSSVMQRVVPQLLQGMEGFDKKEGDDSALLFLGATNVPWQLDPAVMRPGRFDEKVYIPLPDLAARKRLLEIHLKGRPVCNEMNLEQLAETMDGFSGADIKYMCERAAVVPFLRAVNEEAAGIEGMIDLATFQEVVRETPKSVSQEQIKRFQDWQA